MKIFGIFKSAADAVKDPDRDFNERIYLVLTLASELTALVALIGDIYIKENPKEIIVIAATLVFVPLIALVCLHFDKLKLGIRITVIGIVTLLLPALFFFGGGVKGGGIIWIIFAFMYIGLVLNGVLRNIMFIIITVFAVAGYIISYYYPWWVYRHSQRVFFVDSLISLILVGILSFVMTWTQGQLFKAENERAKKEAERAEELTRSQNRFFSSMSHEIRTPINSILGLNELILRDRSASDDIVRDASGIQGSGKMLLALINDILDFSKIEAGSMDIVPVDYSIGDMLSEIVNMMWLRAQDKGLMFEVSVDPEVPSVLYGDEIRIKQILINILNNAVKYTQKGRVELRVESRMADKDTVELLMSVTDTGIGIEKESLPYLFDAFKRVDEGKNRHIEGTGLGLSIVKQLVELMDGSISVNSIYGEGSIFSVRLKQGISDRKRLGELNIHNKSVIRRTAYESSFYAPEARILIVDDNEMNLKVESRLLQDTDIGIDTAAGGREALEMTLKCHYDVILMDHLMPEMDGIECLENIRNQTGGLNRNTPVIVLTANAGSENREKYNLAGFDGYLVKPVSGDALQETVMKHIAVDKIVRKNALTGGGEELRAADKYTEKVPVMVAASSMCDLPDSVVKKLRIPIIPFIVHTEGGIFKDGVHIDANELIRHMNAGHDAFSSPPDEKVYSEFFSDVLKKANHVIYISITSGMSKDYEVACEAARSFDNVSVVNSECLSSSAGILVLIAHKLIQQGLPVRDIVSELDNIKHRLKCSFIINTTHYMSKRGLIGGRLNKITDMLGLHPAIRIKNGRAGIGGLWLGKLKRAYRNYIRWAIPADTIPDPEVAFITYVDVPIDTLNWIEEEIRRTAYFENIIFLQASAGISSNCGSGTFGVLYFLKSNKSYNIASYIDHVVPGEEVQTEEREAEAEEPTEDGDRPEEGAADGGRTEENREGSGLTGEEGPYGGLSCIDVESAIKNSGSEEAFREILKIFYDSIEEKQAELEGYYEAEDWENYTIKIHALKSSSRITGAMELGNKAELLENAGKERDIAYIREHHREAMEEYLSFREKLASVFSVEADSFLMESVYAELLSAAEAGDGGTIEAIMEELSEFSIPAADKERLALIREKAGAGDYEGIKEVLK
ncbi:MAG: DegV family EDD domain-containing protein [Lachnospiraceae bacterium]|nr:DegV family EDD domain-containing protein [Lachnospiraceae bacterium]